MFTVIFNFQSEGGADDCYQSFPKGCNACWGACERVIITWRSECTSCTAMCRETNKGNVRTCSIYVATISTCKYIYRWSQIKTGYVHIGTY